jgi:putative ATP-dependent endonuclease of OLD family
MGEMFMQIKRVRIDNFRAIKIGEMSFDTLTCIIGENNSGKSAFLRALDLFFMSAPKVMPRDFHNGNTEQPIDITIHFGGLTPHELERFAANLIGGELIVTRRLLLNNPKESGQFFVEAEVNPAFAACRNEGSKGERREKYKLLREEFPDLPVVSNADAIDDALEAWEADHPDDLVRQKVGGFRGFKNVAVAQLKERTDFIFVPAVKDAADELGDERKSPVKLLLNSVMRQSIDNNEEFQKFREESALRLRELTSPDSVPALGELSSELSGILDRYYKGSNLVASWTEQNEIPIPYPDSEILVVDNDHKTSVDFVGHGLQRAVIISVLEFVARKRVSAAAADHAFDEAQSDIVIAIEEPELFQHPSKQRLFSALLHELSESFSNATGIRVQVIIATHSPLFVQLSRCHQIRLARRIDVDGESRIKISNVTLQECCEYTAKLLGKEPKLDLYTVGLHTFTPEIAEGFFAKKVVLVEGVSDRALLSAYYRTKGRDPISGGIFIVGTDGKKKMDKPATIFRKLGIPVFVVFDNDRTDEKEKQSEASYNRLIQNIFGCDEANVLDWPDLVSDYFAAYDGNLERHVKQVVGESLYREVGEEFANHYEMGVNDCVKSPSIASGMLLKFSEKGIVFDRFQKILEAVDNLTDLG